MSRWRKVVCIAVAVMMLSAAAARAAAERPVVGFLQRWAENHMYEFLHSPATYGARVLEPEGFRYGLAERIHFFNFRSKVSEQQTYDTLSQFHVVVLDTPWTGSRLTESYIENAETAGRAIERYVREGGSILILARPSGYSGVETQEYAGYMYGDFGLELLREGVWDPERSFEAPVFEGRPPEGFFYTENITPNHPVTNGVERLALPHSQYGPGVVALRLSPEWEVIVRGEQSAQSHPVPKSAPRDVDYGRPAATYRSAPPIAAVRSYGAGRVMVYSLGKIHAHLNYGVPGWKMIVEEAGWQEKGLPSHSNRMIVNGIHWLAETAKDAPGIGTFDTAGFEPITYPESVQWDDRSFRAPVRDGVKGVVGARTALSDGAGTVQDYVEAARAEGLSFIVFTESLESLTEAELKELKEQCKRLSTDDFYAVPGIEFYDHLGNRWATWADRITYPSELINVGDKPFQRDVTQWDGDKIQQLGNYLGQDRRPPAVLLTYSRLREAGGHPHNMWWFFRIAPFVHEEGEVVEDNREEYFYALRDLKRVEPVSYTRITSPEAVKGAAQAMVTVARDMNSLRAWMNSAAGRMNMPAAAPYIADQAGQVRIEQWNAINNQVPYHYQEVRGVQRVRLRFQVGSDAGISEARVRDANMGVIRRFAGNGQLELSREFEMLHDRDYYLVLEVEDEEGATAMSSAIYLWCYKTSVFRCADNHNLLGGRGLVWHSCWDQMLQFAAGGGSLNRQWMGEAVGGYDTSSPWRLMSNFGLSWPIDMTVNTEELSAYPSRYTVEAVQRKVMAVNLPGRDPVVVKMDIGDLVERGGTERRPHSVYAGLPVKVGENELFDLTHRAYYFQNRTNMFTVWDHRRASEGTASCRGDVVWHEGEITFKRDAVLRGEIPIPLATTRPVGGDAATLVLAAEPDGRKATPLAGGRYNRTRPLAAGGYVTTAPNNTYTAFYASSDGDMRYRITARHGEEQPSGLVIGIGEPGREVSAGQKLHYRFAAVRTGGPVDRSVLEYFDELEDIGDSLALGGRGGVEASVEVGETLDREMFFTLAAEDHEVLLDVEPREVIIALPFRVRGLADNGAAAVWCSARPWFRFVGMMEGDAYFQEDVDEGGTIWAGNVFVSDDENVRITVVADGLAEGRDPFIELHNPTGEEIETRVYSPQNTPVFGGMQFDVPLAGGESKRINVEID